MEITENQVQICGNWLLLISAGSILTEIEKSTILKQFFKIEIEPKSIFINLQNRQKTEIGKNSLFLHQI